MQSAVVKGIPASQQILRIPSQGLNGQEEYLVPAIIGKAMARNTKLQVGDTFTARLKNSDDAYDALELQVAQIMNCPVPSLDIGTVWIDLDSLRKIKQLPEVATIMVMQSPGLARLANQDFRHIDEKEFFSDLNQMVKTKAAGQMMPFSMLIFLAMLAIFDTQALAIFKRRKEIGMLSALGMTKGR
jgi:ABC-type lipoprotein release transport system permease subunit